MDGPQESYRFAMSESQRFLHRFFDDFQVFRRFETLQDVSVLVDEKFGEIPLDVRFLLVIGIGFGEDLHENRSDWMFLSESRKPLLALQVCVQRKSVHAVDVNLRELTERHPKTSGTERRDVIARTRSLMTELIAGEVKNLQPLVLICLVEFLEIRVLRGETAFGGCIDDKEDLPFVLGKIDLVSLVIRDFEIIYVHVFYFLTQDKIRKFSRIVHRNEKRDRSGKEPNGEMCASDLKGRHVRHP